MLPNRHLACASTSFGRSFKDQGFSRDEGACSITGGLMLCRSGARQKMKCAVICGCRV